MRALFILLLICIYSALPAQSLISGIVSDESGMPLPFVNIGIRQKNMGTVSGIDGRFSLSIPQQLDNDTLTFSTVGFAELDVPIKTILSKKQQVFTLRAKQVQLNTVTVSAEKLVEKKIGIKRYNPVVHFRDGSTNSDDIFEIAQLMRLGNSLSKITSVNLYINQTAAESATFRINFYSFHNEKPGARLVEKSILQTLAVREGWLSFDLKAHNIYLKGNVVVGIEFIPAPDRKNKPIQYEIKLGGSTQSFVRNSSQGSWNIPPHHYRLYVTALTDKSNAAAADDEENELPPSFRMFSQAVKDTFSIFVKTPQNYQKSKKYPVLYLADANAYMDIVGNAMNERSSQAILVGIGYSNFLMMDSLRNRDYTFPVAPPQDSFPVSGGADKFLTFLETELIPHIDKATAPIRATAHWRAIRWAVISRCTLWRKTHCAIPIHSKTMWRQALRWNTGRAICKINSEKYQILPLRAGNYCSALAPWKLKKIKPTELY